MTNTHLARPVGCRKYAKLGGKQSIGRAAACAIEALEARTLLSVDPAWQLDMALPYLPDTPKAIAPALPDGVEAGPLTVPALHSYPAASAKIYLDFDGHAAMTWGSYSVPATPAYSIDTDPNSFSATELNNIQEIWERVSEKYSPFNVDVTTVDPGNTNDLQTVVAVIGGDGSWLGSMAGGVAYVGGFSNSAPNQVWIFPDNLAAGATKPVGEATAHEVGHSFGLYHQSLYSGGVLVQDYYSGGPFRAPIMGNSYSSERGLWWYGTSTSSTTMQDDLAVIASSTNGFGYKVDDVGDTTGTAGTLTVVNGNISASGIIGNTGDADYYVLDIPVGGTISINQNGPAGAMLDAVLEIRLSDGSFWESYDSTPATTDNIGGTYTAGRYYLVVRSHGDYGDIGQYTISGTIPSVPPNAPSGLTATTISSSQINLSWTDNSSNETGFYIDRASDSGFTANLVTSSVGANVASLNVTGLSATTTYYFRVRAYNTGGSSANTATASATTLDNSNHAPTDIGLSSTSIAENQPTGTAVGTLSTSDPDAGNTFAYTLVGGTGSTDNASFTISGGTLQSAAVFDYAAKSSYSIRVRTTDQGGLWFEKVFTISIIRVDGIAIRQVGSTGGAVDAVWSNGTVAYIGRGGVFAVVDVTTPALPREIGSIPLSEMAKGIAVVGSYAYVAASSSGLLVIDISNPAAPVRVGGYDTSGLANDVIVVGSYAYVADYDAGLQVIDISNPAAPVRVGGYDTSQAAYGVSVVGSYAYVADRWGGLVVINISNPAAPVRVGGYSHTGGDAWDVSVVGSYAYVADWSSGLQVINISNPAAPAPVGGYDTSGASTGVSIVGSYAYVSDYSSGLQVISISSPATPTRMGGYDTSGTAYDVSVAGGYAYVADDDGGLQVISVSNPAAPVRVAGDDVSDCVYGVSVVGSYAYAGYGTGGLQVFDMSNPAAPVRVGGCATSAMNVTVVGSYAYAAGGSSGLQVINIANPAAPVRVGGYDTSGNAYGVSVVGSYAYVADGTSGLQVINIANPAAPVRVGGYDTSGEARAVSVVGNYAYVADYDYGLQVINISNPAAPVRVGGYDTSSYAYDVSVVGGYAYVADCYDGLQVINISNPAAPARVGGDATGWAYGVSVVGNYAYVAHYGSILKVMDISNPAVPVRVGGYDAGGNTYGVRVSVVGSYVYMAGGNGGLAVLQIGSTPTDIGLSPSSVTENQPIGTMVGTFSTADANIVDAFTYSLVSGTGGDDNASFTISGGTLQTAAIFDYETKSSYSIRVRTMDQDGLWFERVFTISVTPPNREPTDVALSPSSIAENQPSGTAVGTFSSTDPDAGNTFTYTLVTGVGSTDNGSFTVSGSTLQSAAIFNFEAKSSYSIRVRTTDQDGLWFEKVFTVTVTNVNETPTDIALSSSSIAENQASGTAVGTFSSTDPDAGNTFTYTLVTGTGSTDNASFTISSGTLQSAAMFNYEAKSSYSIRVRTTDQGGLWFEKTFTVTVTNVNETPTNITLSASSVMEGQPVGTAVGTFSSTDPDAGNTFTYSLVSGSGSTDNASFTVSGGTLQTAAIFNYATQSSYSIRLRTTDQGGLWFEKSFTITVTPANRAPTDISLSGSSIREAQPVGTAVGTFSTTDPDAGNTFAYSLVSGTGSTDNASFTISGGTLRSAAIFNFATKSSYSIRVRTTDQGGLWFEKAFTITVTRPNQAPTDISLSPSSVLENQPIGTTVGTFSTVDPDTGDTFTYTLVDAPGGQDNGSFTISGNTLRTAAVFNAAAKSTYSIRVRSTDAGGLFIGKTFTITVTVVPPNRAPTDISVSASSVAENQPTGTAVGTLGSTDPDAGNTFTYSLVSGSGSTDNASFTISSNTLQTAAVFDFEAKSSYSIRLRTTDQGGLWFEKAFTISVSDVDDTAPTITNVTGPADGWYRVGQNLDFTVNFSENVIVSGVPTIGLTIGTTSCSASYLSGSGSSALVFRYTVQAGDTDADGIASASPMALNGGTIQDAAGNDATLTFAPPATTGVRVDAIVPTVTAVYVKGSTWTSGFLSFLAANIGSSSSTYGFTIPVGSGGAQLQTLPWRNINRISVAFSEDVSVAQAQFAIAGSVGSYSVSGFAYSSTDHVATWSLSAVIGPDKLYIALPGGGATPVTDTAGNALDGEWTNPSSFTDVGASSSFPSGNGVAGGDFAFRFDVLPGDSTGGSLGKVNVADVAQTKSRSTQPVTAVNYRSDVDGNNILNVADVAFVKSKSTIYSLPVNPPVLPIFGSTFSQVIPLLSPDDALLGS